MGSLNMMLCLLSIAALVASTSAQMGGMSGVPPFAFEIWFRCQFHFVPPPGFTSTGLQVALKQGFSSGTFAGLIPSNVEILINNPGIPLDLDVQLFFDEGRTPALQASMFQQIRLLLVGLNPVISKAIGEDVTVTVDSETTLICGVETTTLSFTRLPEIVDFVRNCDCSMDPRLPSCGPVDNSFIIISLIESIDYLLSNALRQENIIEQQGMRLDALEALLDSEVNRLESLIQQLFGLDSNLTGLSSTLFNQQNQIQILERRLEDLDSRSSTCCDQIQMLQGQNQLQEIRLEDLDSLSSTGRALGIAGTVFGALAVLLMVVICVCFCFCCSGCKMPFFTSPRPLGPALPVSPIAQPVINGPVRRLPLVPAACNMARFGIGRMQTGPLYGSYCR